MTELIRGLIELLLNLQKMLEPDPFKTKQRDKVKVEEEFAKEKRTNRPSPDFWGKRGV